MAIVNNGFHTKTQPKGKSLHMFAFAVLSCILTHGCSITCETPAETYTSDSGSSFIGMCWSDLKTQAVKANLKGGEMYFERCGFYNVNYGNDGGAVYINGDGNHVFKYCEFKQVSTAEYRGGGFFMENVASVLVHGCTFEEASAPGWLGGAFCVRPSKSGGFVYIRDTEFSECTAGTYDGAVGHCEVTGSAALQNCTLENCSISYSQTKELKSCIYLSMKGADVPLIVKDCVFIFSVSFSSQCLHLSTGGTVVFEGDVFNGIQSENALVKYGTYEWSKLNVFDCEFQQVVAPCDGAVIDTDSIPSVTVSNSTFKECKATSGTLGGVVLIRASTTSCQITGCNFVANSCPAQVHSLRIVSTSAVNLTGCSFSGHTGALPVLKADEDTSLLSSSDFLLVDCVFDENSLDGSQTGIIAFPADKVVYFSRCAFTNNQATVTLTKCAKASYDQCFFNVSLDKGTYYPVIKDNGTPEIDIIGCSFAHSGTEPDGGVTYVQVSETCKANITQSCFGSSEGSAVSGVGASDSVFGAECEVPWEPTPAPPDEKPDEDVTTTPDANPPPADSPFPYGAVIGGVIGAIAFIAIVAVVIYFVILRRHRQKRDESSQSPETEHSH